MFYVAVIALSIAAGGAASSQRTSGGVPPKAQQKAAPRGKALTLEALKSMDEKALKELTEDDAEQLALLPAKDVAPILYGKDFKPAFLTFVAVEGLHQLNYLAPPKFEEDAEFRQALLQFQTQLGTSATGVLSLAEFGALFSVLKENNNTQEDISLGSKIIWGDAQFASARGTWVFSDGVTKQSSPLQTSEIQCDRRRKTCEQAIAKISNGLLHVERDSWDIASWSGTDVVATEDASLCVHYTLVIDFKNESATMLRRSKNAKNKLCEGMAEAPQALELVDGFKVGWDYFEKKREAKRKLMNPAALEHLKMLGNPAK